MWTVGLVLVCLLGSTLMLSDRAAADPKVPCFFVFGDSLVDNGNNNDMASIARANYAPYGIDFPQGPTGRFTNGKTTIDVITELLGFDHYIPPFSQATGRTVLSGVNYASAAAGIREETGRQLGDRTDFSSQVLNYMSTVTSIVEFLGGENNAADYLSKCIYSVGMGSNDYLNNYFMPDFYSSSDEYTPEEYADLLIQDYVRQLRRLYNYGARKVALIGVGMVGCSPNELARFSSNGVTCIENIDNAIQIFNSRLIEVVDDFNTNFVGAKFTFLNPFNVMRDIVRDPEGHGFTVANRGCCGVGRNNGQWTCLPLQSPCRDRSSYVFWDAYHPTEAANVIFGRRSYKAASSRDAHPYDLHSLAKL